MKNINRNCASFSIDFLSRTAVLFSSLLAPCLSYSLGSYLVNVAICFIITNTIIFIAHCACDEHGNAELRAAGLEEFL